MRTEGRSIRVVVADDHPIFLDAVAALLAAARDFSVVGLAGTGNEALKLMGELAPDVAVLDVAMPEANGVSVLSRAAEVGCLTRVLVLSMHEERVYVEQSLAAGARGYLLKRSTGENLVQAVRAVAAGGFYLDPSMAGRYLGPSGAKAGRSRDAHRRDVAALTDREEEVMRFFAHGYTSKEVAAKLGITRKTVETFKMRAADKLGIVGRAKLVEYALMRGWLGEPAA